MKAKSASTWEEMASKDDVMGQCVQDASQVPDPQTGRKIVYHRTKYIIQGKVCTRA